MRNFDTIRRMELEDWNRNAAFYRDDADAPLMRHLAQRRDATYALQPGERVLDLGCGTGATVARLRSQGIDAVGIDFAPEMVRAATQQHDLAAHVTCAEATQIPFEDQRFDVVMVDGVLHHLAVQGKLIAALREVRRVLKPGGRLCVFDRNGSIMSGLLLRVAITAKTMIGLVTGRRHYPSSATRNEISFGGLSDQRLLKRCGFLPVRSRPVASAPFFMSVVLLNAMQYFLSRRLRQRLEIPVARMVSWIDDRCAFAPLCVEQISVWQSVAPRLPQRTIEVTKLGANLRSMPVAQVSIPKLKVNVPLPVLHAEEVV